MITVIEGPDGAGKTTLANRLETYGFDYLHFSQPQRTPIEEYTHPLTQDDWLAIDRFHLGEGVYGPLYRGQSGLAPHQKLYVDLYLESRAACLVLKIDEPTVLVKRCERRGEDYLKMVDMPKVVNDFYREFDSSHMTHKLLNPQPKQVADRCAQLMGIWRDLRPFPYYVGKRYPKMLLVGDEPGTTQPRILHVPFVPVPASSGDYLWRTIYEARFLSYGVVNSRLADGTDTPLRALWTALDKPNVVALGQRASSRLDAAEVPHGVVPHPQYVRRFKNAYSFEYGHMIYKAWNLQRPVTEFAA